MLGSAWLMSIFEMDAPDTQYMRLFVNMSKCMAFWPIWRTGRLFRIYYYTVFCIVAVSLSTTCLTLFLKIATSFEDMDGIATVIDFATVFASGVFRYFYIFCRGAAYHQLIDTMYQRFTYVSFNPNGETLTMEKMKILGKRVGLLYFFGSMVFIFQMVIGPIFIILTDPTITQIPLIFEGWHPFNTSEEPTHTIVYVVQSVSWLSIGYAYLTQDAFWYAIIIMTIGQLQIICHSFRNLELDVNGELPEHTQVVISKCIKQHQIVRSFIKDIESLLSPIIIVDFMHAVLSITFLMLDITIWISKGNWVKVLNLSEYLIVSIVHMFAFNWLGNELAIQEEKIAKALYNIPWYKEPTREWATTIMFTTAASRKPIRLTGGKFYNLTLEFFVLAIKTIFSYFTVLFQLRYEN